jgi:hypothetical protein
MAKVMWSASYLTTCRCLGFSICLITAALCGVAYLPIVASDVATSQRVCAVVSRVKVGLGKKSRWVVPDPFAITSDEYVKGMPLAVELKPQDHGKARRLFFFPNTEFVEDIGITPADYSKEHWSILLLPGTAERPSPLEFEVKGDRVQRVIRRKIAWYGSLIDVAADSVTLQGVRRVPSYGTEVGHFEAVFDPVGFYVRMPDDDQQFRIATSSATQYSVNRDGCSYKVCAQNRGRLVTVIADCAGSAAYVDVLKLSTVFSFSGGPRPLVLRTVRTKDGRRVMEPVAFVEQYDSKGKPQKTIRISRNVKAYSVRGVKYDWFKPRPLPEGGFAGVWIDPHSKLVTHIFWSESGA